MEDISKKAISYLAGGVALGMAAYGYSRVVDYLDRDNREKNKSGIEERVESELPFEDSNVTEFKKELE